MPEPRRRHVPVKRSVRDRWFLPAGKHRHISVPFALAQGVLMDLNLEELRTILWLLGDWYWPGGLEREVNAVVLANRTGMDRANVRRALASMAARGIIELRTQGKGRMAVVSIKPLVEIGRSAASKGESDRLYRPRSKRKVSQIDSSESQIDSPSRVNGEPGAPASESFPSDSFRCGAESAAGGGASQEPTASENGHGGRKKTPADIDRELAHFLLAEAQAKAAASAKALAEFKESS